MPTPAASAGAANAPGPTEARPARPAAAPDPAWRARAEALAADAGRARDRRAAAALWLEAGLLRAAHDDPNLALDHAERALALAPGHPGALDLLERLHAGEGAALCERLARAADEARDPAARAAVLCRLAAADRDLLGDPALALRDAERALALDPGSGAAARLAVEALLAAGRPADAAAALDRHAAAGAAPSAVAGLRARVADAALAAGDRELSCRQVEAALREAPDDAALAARLEAAWEEAGAWDRLGEALAARAAAAPEAERPALWLRLARCRAAAGDHAGHADVLEDLARSHALPAERARAWLGAAALRAGRLADPRRAFACAAEALRADPADLAAREACERFAGEAGAEADLYALYDEVAGRPEGAAGERELRLRLAELAEHDPARRAAAVDHLRRALALAPGDGEASSRLARLEMAAGHWGEARALLAAQAPAAHGPERAALLEKVAEIALDRLGDAQAAAAALEEALGACGDDARPRLTRKLVAALEALAAAAEAAGDRAEHARHERRIATLAADELRQDALALAALVRAVRAQPADATARGALVRAARAAGAPAEAARVLAEVAGAAGEAAPAVLADLASLREEELRDPAAACDAWEAARALAPDDPAPLAALRRLQRALGRRRELARTCAALAERATEPAERAEAWREAGRTFEALAGDAAGGAAEDARGGDAADLAAARDAWRAVLALVPGDAEAGAALERLLAALDDPAALAAHLDLRRAAGEGGAALELRLAELRRLRLGDPAGALALVEGILAREPGHAGARAALLELCAAPGEVGRAALARADALVPAGSAEWARAAALAPCLALERRAARALDPAGPGAGRGVPDTADGGGAPGAPGDDAGAGTSPAGAAAAREAWLRVLASEPGDAEALAALDRLLGDGDPAPLRAEVARRRLAAARGPARRPLAVRAAELAQAAGDVEGALLAWREALAQDPADRRAMAAVAALARRPGAWDAAAEALEAAHRARGDARALAGVLAARADRAPPAARGAAWREVAALRERLGDAAGACDALARAAEAAPSGDAWAALARARGRAGDARGRAAALARLAATEPGSRRAAEARREVAEQAEREGDRAAALAAWREVLAGEPEDPGALRRLEEHLEAAGRWEELPAVLERRAALLPAGRAAEGAALLARAGTVRAERLGDAAGALADLRAALERAPSGPDARAALHALALSGGDAAAGAAELLAPAYEREGEHARLAELLAARAAAEPEPAARAATLARLAALRAGPLGDPEAGFLDAARALRDDPGCEPALALAVELAPRAGTDEGPAAERGGAEAEAAGGLEELLADCAARARGPAQRLAALRALARHAAGAARAAAAWNEVLALAPEDPEALAGLAAAHRAAGDPAGLAAALRRRLDAGAGDAERPRLLDELARAELERGEPAAAAAALEELLDLSAAARDDRALLARLDEALAGAGRWDALAGALAREIDLADRAGDREAARALRVRLAGLRDERQGDREGAIALCEAVLAEAPDDAGALAALELVLEDEPGHARAAGALLGALQASGDRERLAGALARHAAACAEPARAKPLLRRLAALREALGEPGPAFAAALAAFRADPADPALREPLERLAAAAGEEEELAAAWEEAAEARPAGASPGLELALGALWDRLGSPARAADWYARARAADPARDGAVLPELERLHAAAGRWAELDGVLAALAARDDGPARAAVLARQAALREERLGDAAGALAAWTEALAADPGSLPALRARARLARAAGDLGPQVALAEALAEAGEGAEAAEAARVAIDAGVAGAGGALAARLDAACARAGAAAERARLAEAAAEALAGAPGEGPQVEAARAWLDAAARWDEAGEAPRAAAALERALTADPASSALAVLRERLAAAGAWAELARVCAEHADRMDDPGARSALLVEAAELREARLGQPELAFLAWCRALSHDPGDPRAAEGAARLAAATGSWEELAALWEQATDRLEGPRRAAALHALGALRAERLADPQGALGAWRAALEADPAAEAPREALCAALAREGRHAEAAGVLARAAEAAGSAGGGARVALLRRLAALREERLADPAAALEAWRAVRDAEPGAADAAEAVIRLAERAGRWDDLHAALVARAAAAPAAERPGLHARAAAVAEERLADPARALASAAAALEADPASTDALERLARLHGALGNPAARAAALERHALLATGGERAGLCLAAAESRRAAGDAAGEERALREALRADPEAREALDALARLHEARGEAVAALELLDRLAALAPGDAQAGAALSRAARLQERRGDREAAVAAWRRALEADPSSLEALRALRAAAEAAPAGSRERARAAELLAREARAAREPAERARLCAELAARHRESRGDLDEAARWLEEAAAALPGDSAVSAALAGVRLASGDLAAAARLLEAAAGAEGVAPREAARRWHRLALARERLGRRDEALAAARRAHAADPGYLPAALALPRLLRAAGVAGEEPLAALRSLLAHHAAALTPAEIDEAHRESGALEERAGRPGRAAASYAAALEADPDDAAARERLAALLAAQGDARGALAHERRLAADLAGPARAAALARAGALCRRLSDARGAVEAFEAALALDPACLEALAGLEPLLDGDGRHRDLERRLREALAALPRGPEQAARRLAAWRALAALYAGPLADPGSARTAAGVAASIEADARGGAGG